MTRASGYEHPEWIAPAGRVASLRSFSGNGVSGAPSIIRALLVYYLPDMCNLPSVTYPM